MAHFTIIGPAAAGHLFGMGSLGCELQRRGHQVSLLAPAEAAPLARQLGLPHCELPAGNFSEPLWQQPIRTVQDVLGLGFRRRQLRRALIVLQHAPQALQQLGTDVLLVDRTFIAGGTVAQHLGIPFITISTGLLWNEEIGVPPHFTGWTYGKGPWSRLRNRAGYAFWHAYTRPWLRALNRYRRRWNLPPLRHVDDAFSRTAHIAQMCPELDFPRRELPDNVHYVGAMVTSRPTPDCDFPWHRLDGRPLIYASMGTIVSRKNRAVFRRIAEACADLEAQLVISLGAWYDQQTETSVDDWPGNPVVVNFAPQVALLKRADLLITHAGANTVLESLSHAVPMLALPRRVDQPANAARIARAGAGLRGSLSRSTPRQLRDMIQHLLTVPSFRQRAADLQRALATAGGVERAADIVQQTVLTGRRAPATQAQPPRVPARN